MEDISRFDLYVSSNTACHMLLGRHKNVENVLNAASRRGIDTAGLEFQDYRLDRFLPSGVKFGFKIEVILYFRPSYQLHPWLNLDLKSLSPAFYKNLPCH